MQRRTDWGGGGVSPSRVKDSFIRSPFLDHTMHSFIIVITTMLLTVTAYDAYSAYREQRSIYSRPNLDTMIRKPIGYLAGEPIYPRSYGDGDSREGASNDSGEIVVDENGAVYRMPKRYSMLNILRRRVYI